MPYNRFPLALPREGKFCGPKYTKLCRRAVPFGTALFCFLVTSGGRVSSGGKEPY